MYRFSGVTYDSATQTATIGAGMIWDDVYVALERYGVNVAGARVSGIGVAGFTLGGGGLASLYVLQAVRQSDGRVGYSWHANLYGLAIDMVEAFELVLPNGTVTNVTASKADLFFALKVWFPVTDLSLHINLSAGWIQQLRKCTYIW